MGGGGAKALNSVTFLKQNYKKYISLNLNNVHEIFRHNYINENVK